MKRTKPSKKPSTEMEVSHSEALKTSLVHSDISELVSVPKEVLRLLLAQVRHSEGEQTGMSPPYLKYAFEFFKLGSELMNVFGNLQLVSFSKQAAVRAPSFPGLYLVFRGDALVYVGVSENLRRRLHEHIRGKSNFAQAVKARYKPNNYADFLAGNFSLHFKEFDDKAYLQQLEHVIIGVFRPTLNQE
jgi:hypothetical protein